MIEKITQLEVNGKWEDALKMLRMALLTQGNLNSEEFHTLGRLYQRLNKSYSALKCYEKALEINSNMPKTINNLIILELNLFNTEKANFWIEKAKKIPYLSPSEEELIYNSGCDLKLFELSHLEAIGYVNKVLESQSSIISLCNKSICLQKLNLIDESISVQLKAIGLQLTKHCSILKNSPISELVGKSCGSIEESIRLHIMLMNLGVLELSKNPFNKEGLKLIQAGMYYDRENWISQKIQI